MDSLQELYNTVHSTIDSSKFSLSLTRPAWNFDKTNFFSAITRTRSSTVLDLVVSLYCSSTVVLYSEH